MITISFSICVYVMVLQGQYYYQC